MTSKERILLALRRSGKNQSDLAKRLDRDRATVSEVLNKPGDIDSVRYLEATAEITGFSFEWLRTGEGAERPDDASTLKNHRDQDRTVQSLRSKPSQEIPSEISVAEPNIHVYLTGKNIRPVTVTVDRSGRELITYVPVKAQAGYLRGYGDAKYLEKLPAYSLPIAISGTHRMFQVDGNSMRQLGGGGLHDGDIVIAQYVENIFELRDNRVYVIVSTEGLIIKRIINRLTSPDKVLVCNSDNKSGEYPPIILHPNELLEAWELKAFISKQLGFSTDLYDTINDMQVKLALMDDKIKSLQEKEITDKHGR